MKKVIIDVNTEYKTIIGAMEVTVEDYGEYFIVSSPRIICDLRHPYVHATLKWRGRRVFIWGKMLLDPNIKILEFIDDIGANKINAIGNELGFKKSLGVWIKE